MKDIIIDKFLLMKTTLIVQTLKKRTKTNPFLKQFLISDIEMVRKLLLCFALSHTREAGLLIALSLRKKTIIKRANR